MLVGMPVVFNPVEWVVMRSTEVFDSTSILALALGAVLILVLPLKSSFVIFTGCAGETGEAVVRLMVFVGERVLLMCAVNGTPEMVTFIFEVSLEVTFPSPAAASLRKSWDKGNKGEGRKSNAGDAGGDAMMYDTLSYDKLVFEEEMTAEERLLRSAPWT